MLYQKEGYPEEDELVMCTVTKVQFNSVFVSIDDYNKSGMIHISEISPGRIRNIRDFVKEGKVIVCKVLRVNQDRGQVDLSLRRVSEGARRSKVEEVKQEQKAEKIVEFIASKLGTDVKTVYNDVFAKVGKKYGMLHNAFMAVVEGELKLGETGLDKKTAEVLEAEIIDRIKPAEVKIDGIITAKSFEPNGAEIIRNAFRSSLETGENITISYLGGGKYHISVVANDYEEAEERMEKATQTAITMLESHNSIGTFVREE